VLANEGYKFVLTGGNGFLGSHLLKHEAFQSALVIGRTKPRNYEHFKPASFEVDGNLAEIFKDTEVVVHVAARAHIMNETAISPIDEYRRVNTAGTLNLAKQAAVAGVKRFIFISTVKVLGEETKKGHFFTSEDHFNPQDPYSVSKAEAEVGLKLISDSSGMEFVIIRPPLVYGHGVKGNFASLLKLVKMSVPLPFGSIQNKRSLVSVENLVDLIAVCLNHPNAKNQTFLVSDDHDLSTPELCRLLAKAGDYKSRIFPFPRALLWSFLIVIGKKAVYERLSGSMEINIELTKSQLNWKPPHRVKDSLINCWLP
jgi:UDP-glucose 4-epimerase